MDPGLISVITAQEVTSQCFPSLRQSSVHDKMLQCHHFFKKLATSDCWKVNWSFPLTLLMFTSLEITFFLFAYLLRTQQTSKSCVAFLTTAYIFNRQWLSFLKNWFLSPFWNGGKSIKLEVLPVCYLVNCKIFQINIGSFFQSSFKVNIILNYYSFY